MNRKAIIFGIKGTKLTFNEKLFLRKQKPWGVILFSRNIKNLQQLKTLIKNIKSIFRDNKYPILIDQEGGSVSRLNKIIDLRLFSQDYFGYIFKKNKKSFLVNYKVYINTVCHILKNTGININTVPVLDVKKNSFTYIGKRSFSSDPSIVRKIGNICINLYKKNKIATVVKHIPGHGGTIVDSHFTTPKINTSIQELKKRDFKPFKDCKSLFAMTSHAIYKAYDTKNVCTHSKEIIKKVVRKYMNFKGILISDDISMKALNHDLKNNATKALDSGCNLVLHCNGNISEMNELSKIIPTIDKFTQKKTRQFYDFLG